MLNDALQAVAVVGAGGKMGSGISLLLLQEMARLEAELTGTVGKRFRLFLIDANPDALSNLYPYLRTHLTRYAERNIVALRGYFADNEALVSNGEIIQAFVDGAIDSVRCDTDIAKAARATLVFEAIKEEIDSKVQLFKTIASLAKHPIYYLTNTSSIPIHILNERASLNNRIIGFHFYNPPAVQKLVELVIPPQTDPQLIALAQDLGKRLDKHLVKSQDIAGFIGNGHLLREIMYACERVHAMSREYSLAESLYMVNKVTQDFLIRPMGIFQLLDYVGIDICKLICEIMNSFLPEELFQELFQDSLIDEMIADDRLGGQYPDGSQKNGFFAYEGPKRIAIYSPEEQAYVPLDGTHWISACDKLLGSYPGDHASWKHLVNDPERSQKLSRYFQNMEHLSTHQSTLGVSMAQGFLQNSRQIAQLLVSKGVAQSLEDVDTILQMGFFHLYGPNTAILEKTR
ncbi:MAG: 3-hydroxyacyl-CoA dehydrogenase family protein [Parachlamydia sp.]|nr:3-hydroxyacyl-CoA dehydrogenase family protein [Parachlamydia sp.]